MQPFHVETLAGGRELVFWDDSNRYYGDYHRVRIVARMEVPLTVDLFLEHPDPDKALRRARRRLGDQLRFERSLERMAVPGDSVDSVRRKLVQHFLETGRTYLEHPRFLERLVQKQLQARRNEPVVAPISP